MATLREWMHRMWGAVRRNARDREIEEELGSHLELAAEQMESRDATPDAARRAARIEHGGVAQALESMRDQRGFRWLADLPSDIRYALRMIGRNPGFAALAVVIMALGIGANTAVFSVVNAVMLKPLAYRDADRIVTLSTLWKTTGADQPSVSVPDYHDWHDQNTSFEAMAYFQAGDTAVIAGPTAEFAADAAVTNEFFKVFGVQPVAGRDFSEEESKPGSGAAAMISYSFWQSHYGGERSAIGKTLQLGGRALTIVGVLPPAFRFPAKTDIWFPANTIFRESTIRAAHNVSASSILLVNSCRTILARPAPNAALRAISRARVLALARRRLATLPHATLVAGVTGVVSALAGSRALVLLAPANVPRLENTGIDGSVLGFAFGASVLACLIFGLVPAIRTTRVNLNTSVKQGTAQNTGAGKSRLRRALVAAEIALSVVLLAAAGLLIRSFAALHDVALGFEPEHVLLMETSVTARMTAQQAMPVYRRLIDEISSIPGVIAAGATRTPPGAVRSSGPYWVDEAPTLQQINWTNRPQAIYSYASPGIFAALGVPVQSGREFGAADNFDAPPRAIVNQALAKRAFPGRDPIGHTIAGYR